MLFVKYILVGRKAHNHNNAFCEKKYDILTECVDFYATMNIKYGAIIEINAESQKNSDI